MLRLGLLCCLVIICVAKEKRFFLFGNTGNTGGLTGGSGGGLTGGLTGASGSGFLLGSSNLLSATTKYWTNLMSALLGGYNITSALTGGGAGGLGSLPGLSGGLPGLSGSLPGLSGSLPGLSGGLLGGGGATGSLPTTASSLAHYNIDKSKISVSGLSAGGAMATQLHVIYSSDIMGAGIIAGLPFYCTNGGGVMAALTTCMRTPGSVDLASIQSKTAQGAQSGEIDATSNMQNDKVYIFDGTLDTTVNPGIGPVIKRFYEHYMSPSNIKTVFDKPAQHGQPTNNYGGPCGTQNTQNYINNCGYSAAYDLLNFIYGGNLTEPSPTYSPTGEILSFSQSEFISSPASHGMDELGYIYVPTSCKNGAVCKLHIAVHGCKQGRQTIGDAYIAHAGYNEVADLNNIVVLYPQAVPSMMNGNPNGCFDWWGYDGNNFATNKGSQTSAIKQMIDRMTG